MTLTSEPTLRLILMGFAASCVLWGVVKGIARMVLLAISAAAGIAAGWAFFRYAPVPMIAWLNGFHADAVQWGAVVCAVAAFLFLQRFLSALFGGKLKSPVGSGPRVRAGAFSLIPALLMVWCVAMAIRWGGAVSRMRWVEDAAKTRSQETLNEQPLLARLRTGASSGMLGEFLDRVDPLHSRETSALGAILAVRHSDTAWKNLMALPEMAPLAGEPLLRHLLKDKTVQHAISFSHYSELLTLPELTEALQSPEIRKALHSLPVDDLIRAAIQGVTPTKNVPRAEIVL